MRGYKPLDVLYHDDKDHIAKLLHRLIPLLDDSLDEGLLNDEWIATGEFPGAGSDKQDVSKVQVIKRSAHW